MDSVERFRETTLPPQPSFYSSLTGEGIKDEDYQHAKTVWDAFKIQNLGEYHDLYVLTDVLLLADVFQNFRHICKKTYNLDPCHFLTSPGLAFEAALKLTGVRLELLTDIDQYLFIEKGIRGGVAMISNRYAKANNKYLENYDASQPSTYISYLDANNLYGFAMSLPLPVKGFKWMSREEIEQLDIMSVPLEGDTGYILSVDLDYPDELHDTHSDYPLAPEQMEVTQEMLSPYSVELRQVLGLSEKTPVTKLVPNLYNKRNYIVHFRNLQQYIKLGLKLVKINKVLTFKQQPWLKPYIDLNTDYRKNAQNDFEKDFYKLMNNAVFGKSMENLRNRMRVDLVQTEKKLKRRVASPAFHAFKIFSEGLVGVHMKKACLELNRPIYTGFTILDNSKTLMYDFHYNYIKKKYGDKAELQMTDTDSLNYLIQTEDVYRDMLKDKHLFDTSEYPKDHFLFSNENKKVLGKMKDELAGVPGEETVGLRPKMYSMKVGGKEKKRAKGISRATVRRDIRHQDYKDCLFERQSMSVNITRINSRDHNLTTVQMRKLGLSATDDKRYVLRDGIHTLAHGHYRIRDGSDL